MIWCGRAEGTIQVLCAPPGIRTRTCGLGVRDGSVRPVRHRALTCSFVHDALQLVVPCPPSCLVIASEIVGRCGGLRPPGPKSPRGRES